MTKTIVFKKYLYVVLFLFVYVLCQADDSALNIELMGGYSSVLMIWTNAERQSLVQGFVDDGFAINNINNEAINHGYNFNIGLSKRFSSPIGYVFPYINYEYMSVITSDLVAYWQNGTVYYRSSNIIRPSCLVLGVRYGLNLVFSQDSNLLIFIAPDAGILTTYGNRKNGQWQSNGNWYSGSYRENLLIESIFPIANLHAGGLYKATKNIGLIIDGGYKFAKIRVNFRYIENSDVTEVGKDFSNEFDYSGWFIKSGVVYTLN